MSVSRLSPLALVMVAACGGPYRDCPIVGTWRDASLDNVPRGDSAFACPNQTFDASGMWSQEEWQPSELHWRPASQDGTRITIEFPDAHIESSGTTFKNTSAFRTFVFEAPDLLREDNGMLWARVKDAK